MLRRAFVFGLLLALGARTPARSEPSVVRAIDPLKSHAQFSVAHIWVERVVGTVPIAGGSVTFAPGSAIPVAATAVLDATKLKTDEPDRDNALRSPDFFDTAKFPTWTFASSKISANGSNAFGMDGNLTIHGVTRPEHLDVTIGGDAEHPVYHAVGHIDRREFGMTVTRLDPTIGQIADVTLDVVLK
jgi:polyisoprenoid-binding protein YceI